MTRTFIALEMNREQQDHLAGVIRQVARCIPDARLVNPQGIHLTLAFLGELDDAQLKQVALCTSIAARQVPTFTYQLTRLGIFGTIRQPRVIWMGIEERSGSLVKLHKLLNDELDQHGFPADKRPFSPHLTLARLKAPLSIPEQTHLQTLLNGPQQGIVTQSVYTVRTTNVMKSELQLTGAKYTVLYSYKLQG